jgi:hypothetical protein
MDEQGNVVLNLDEIPSGFSPIPSGQYLVEITEAVKHVSKAEQQKPVDKQTPGMKLTLTIVGQGFAGRKLWTYLSAKPAALFKVDQFARAIENRPKDLSLRAEPETEEERRELEEKDQSPMRITFKPEYFLGHTVVAKVEHQFDTTVNPNTGKPYGDKAEVKDVFHPSWKNVSLTTVDEDEDEDEDY